MKYIDADLLRKKIAEQMDSLPREVGRGAGTITSTGYGMMQAFQIVRTILDSLQQEQPKVDLEKFTEKIKTFQGRYKYPESTSIKGAMAFMARLFYQYPNTAREWYESLPKVTMD